LLGTLPLTVIAVAALALRHMPAGTRILIWRTAVMVLLIVYVGQLLPHGWLTGVVPSTLAAPLVALGRMQLVAGPMTAPDSVISPAAPVSNYGVVMVIALLVVYWLGVATVLGFLIRAARTAHLTTLNAERILDDGQLALLAECMTLSRVRRRIRLVSGDVVVPVTSGLVRPVIVLPREARWWDATRLRAVLLHELAHVKAADALFVFLARVSCALYWFHPASWWIARKLRMECELASDDHVLSSGIRASEYAEVLLAASDAMALRAGRRSAAIALASHGNLYRRIAAISHTGRDTRAPRQAGHLLAAALTLFLSLPVSGARLAPSRDVLTTLMSDGRWESRAYAVIGLAQRPDSIEVARAASELDPSPQVRALARVALDHRDGSQALGTLLRELPALLQDRR
jgi:beta-lactamase regulating signal transducer with metallopeptidase domain